VGRERNTLEISMINNGNSELKVTSDKTCCGCGHSHGDEIFAVGIVATAGSGRQYQLICPDLPLVIHRDDIDRGRIDVAAVRRREEAELKRRIAASQKPYQPALKCDHERVVKSHVFADGNVLKLYGCGCSNGTEILNGRKIRGK
jgi:hypothetical protein